MKKLLLITVILGLMGSFFWIKHHWHYSVGITTTTPIIWAKEISQETLEHSWATWRDFYSPLKNISREEFYKAVMQGIYKVMSIREFLELNVENQRLNRYRDAKTAEEFYPLEDRPRGDTDITSVNYHVSLQYPISPILVAMVIDNGTMRYIKLDGVHRLIAAAIRKSPIKVLFIEL